MHFRKWNLHEQIARGEGVVSAWIVADRLTKKAQARLDRALDQLLQLPKQDWHKPNPASALGNHAYVIRFTDESRKQWRIFGHFHDPHYCFVMTGTGFEKDDEYEPENYLELAKSNKTKCDEDFQGYTKPYKNRCNTCPPRTDATSSLRRK